MQRVPIIEEDKGEEKIKKSKRNSICGKVTKDAVREKASISH